MVIRGSLLRWAGSGRHWSGPCNKVAQAPEHHERDDVGGILRPVQHRAGAFVELLAAGPAAKAPVTMGGALGPLRHRLRPALNAPHPTIRPAHEGPGL